MQQQRNILFPNPFPGLRPFTRDEGHLFFGREGQSETIVSYLSKSRFAAVTGASGSGKSSLIYCGVIPLLYGGFISEAGSKWQVLAARPGNSPIWNLAVAFSEFESTNKDQENTNELKEYYYSLLNRHSLGLIDAIEQAIPKDGSNLLLVIDQFEELFRYQENSNEHHDDTNAFIKLLVNILNQKQLPVYIVLTMRSDFIGNCSDFQELTTLINKSNYLVPQMTREDFERVILGPLKVAHTEIEPRLLHEILNSLENNHDQLPVLQHALMRTWEFWSKNDLVNTPLTIRDYMAAGNIKNALSLHANIAYNELDERGKQLCKILFKALTEKGKDGKGIRRPASIQEIAELAQAQPREIIEVVEVFRIPGRSFLTPDAGVELNPSSIIDISHESLMRIWDKLRLWVDEEAASAQMYERLIELAGLYQTGRTGLMRSPDLQTAINWKKNQHPNKAWARRYNPAFEKAMVYLNTSEKKFQQDEESKIKIQRRELYRTRRVAILLGVIAIAFFALMFYAYRQSQEAFLQKERAESYASLVEGEKNEVLQLSQEQRIKLLREQGKIDSLTMARQLQLIKTEESKQSYQELINEVTRRTEELQITTENVTREKQHAERIAKSAQEDRSKAELETKAEYRKRMQILSNALSIKSSQVDDKQLSGLLAYHAYIINRENGGQINHPEIYRGLYDALKNLKGQKFNTLQGHSSQIKSIVFDPARNYLYSAEADGTIYRWGFRRENPTPATVIVNDNGNTCLDITKDGRWLASGSENGTIRLINAQLSNQTPRVFNAHEGNVLKIKFIPGKNALVTSGTDNKVKYWDLLTNEQTIIFNDNSGITGIAPAPSGKNIVCVTKSGKLLMWTASTGKIETLYTHSSKLHSVAYDYESERIAVGDMNGNIILINAATGNIIKSLHGHSSRVLDLQFSPDNRLLASSGLDGIIRIWNADDLNDLPIEIKEHESWVESISFSPDGKNLLSTSNDGNLIYIWPVKANLLAEDICSYLKRQLTQIEWKQYIGDDVEYRTVCE
jgi:WD40 repeat protein